MTRACLGPGACEGAQACLPDGSALGPCDCGTGGLGAAAGGSGGVGAGGNAGVGNAGADCGAGVCWWSGQSPSGCDTAGVPTPEMRPKQGMDVEQPPIYLGLTSVRLGALDANGNGTDEWQQLGLDLDGVCTNSITCASETRTSCRSGSAELPFDGELCRDNTFGRLFELAAAVPDLSTTLGVNETDLNCLLWNGAFTIITKVTGYNGMADDDRVRVDFYISPGTETPSPWTCPLAEFANTFPRWLTSTPWRISANELTAPISEAGQLPDSTIADADAYVRQGYLAARLPRGSRLGFAGEDDPFPGFDLTFADEAVYTGEISRGRDGTWLVRDGLLAGRILSDDILDSFRAVGFCPTNPLYAGLENFVRANADVLGDGTTDDERACDALSAGIAFEAAQVRPGQSEVRPARPGCP